jgi:hypothetical protein
MSLRTILTRTIRSSRRHEWAPRLRWRAISRRSWSACSACTVRGDTRIPSIQTEPIRPPRAICYSARLPFEALGLIETKGLIGAVEAADAYGNASVVARVQSGRALVSGRFPGRHVGSQHSRMNVPNDCRSVESDEETVIDRRGLLQGVSEGRTG